MAITNIHTGQSYVNFLQPKVGEEITIRIDIQIAWINDGYYVHIPNGGIYEVVSAVVFNYTLKLIKDYREEGAIVSADVIHPVPIEVTYIKPTHRVRFDYNTGDSQIFDTGQTGIKVMSVLVNGVGLDISQYNDDTEENTADGTIEILDELSNADYIDIYYEK